MGLPNDDEELQKNIEEQRKLQKQKLGSQQSLTSSQVQKLNRSIDSKVQLVP
jgi:hypothetical protein